MVDNSGKSSKTSTQDKNVHVVYKRESNWLKFVEIKPDIDGKQLTNMTQLRVKVRSHFWQRKPNDNRFHTTKDFSPIPSTCVIYGRSFTNNKFLCFKFKCFFFSTIRYFFCICIYFQEFLLIASLIGKNFGSKSSLWRDCVMSILVQLPYIKYVVKFKICYSFEDSIFILWNNL